MNDIKTLNRAFDEMRKPALARLHGKEAEVLAGNTGIDYDKNQRIFSLTSMSEKIQVHYPQYEITPELNDWHHLLLLHYMDVADGTPLSGQLMTFWELPGGMVRGGGFDRQSERTLSLQLVLRTWSEKPVKPWALKSLTLMRTYPEYFIFSPFIPLL